MSIEDDQARLSALLSRVKELAGEHFDSFVFIGNVEHEDGTSQTVSTWDGGFNEAVGMTARMQERLRQSIISTDFPDEPPEGEDWKKEQA